MKNKSYSVVGDKKQGRRIAVPESTGIQTGDRFDFTFIDRQQMIVVLPGTLLFAPAPRHTSKREKKGVSG